MGRKKMIRRQRELLAALTIGKRDAESLKRTVASNQVLTDKVASLQREGGEFEGIVADNARLRDAVESLKGDRPLIQPSVLRAVSKAGYAFHTYGSQDETEVVVKYCGDPDYGKRFVHEHSDIAFSKAVDDVWKNMAKTSETFTGTDT